MEEEATQPGTISFYPPLFQSDLHSPYGQPRAYDQYFVATQQVIDPRRLGQANSGLNAEDLADIFCILHPISLPAYRAAAVIHEYNPRHTISTQSDVKIREKNGDGLKGIGTLDLAAQGIVSCDVVLRLSANLKDSLGGYRFGRNPQRCDFVIGRDDEVKRVSNVHFRIYINDYGVIMLEDQSTNGTAVDGILLRAKEKENGTDYRHTLEQGSIIVLTMTPPEEDFKFIVRIPQRDEESEMAYQQNLTNYINRTNNANLERQKGVAGTGGVNKDPPNIFAAPDSGTPDPTTSSNRRYIREWRGGNKYNKVRIIGKGAFAVVYQVTAKFDGVPYAAKELEKRRFMKHGILDQKVDMEIQIMQKIKHDNIVRYIEHEDFEEYLYLILEYVPGGDLGSLINRCGRLSEPDVKTMAGQLLSALKYLHSMGVTHRDVKPDNILIHTLKPLHVKLTDFGLSKMVDSEETFLRTFCGTLLYCAPEVYSEYREYDDTGRRNLRGMDKKSLPPQRYDDAVDIWSLAGVLFYALCASPPYPVKSATTYQELLNHIMTQALDIRPLQLANISESGIRFVRAMLHTRPQHRATIKELEESPWLSGVDSMEISLDEDEVDMIVDGLVEPDLRDRASQLSINDPNCIQINDSNGGFNSASDLTEIQEREIPSSFSTSGGNSNGSYGFTTAPASLGNGRLFGEVNIATLGSSGAIPLDHLPVLTVNHRGTHSDLRFSQESIYTQSEPSRDFSRMENGSQQARSAATMPMPPPPPPINQTKKGDDYAADERAARSSSLMGTESLVGHLNMHSPPSALPPATDASTSPTANVQDATISLRRAREDMEGGDDQSWRPFDLPPKKRRRSEREIDMPVPPSIFWDPRDRSTHHNNYPRMSVSDFKMYREYAEGKGELFEHGQKTFETTMQSFRSSRSPSLEPEAATRAYSEPTRDEGRRITMKRDERKLGEEVAERGATTEYSIPSTARGSNEPPQTTIESDIIAGSIKIASPAPETLVGDNFLLPKRILAKLVATSDSCLPAISLNLTENLTSWGRGFKNTIRYANGQEIRVPKYAFKVLLFKTGFYTPSGTNPIDNSAERNNHGIDQEMAFYVSSKASVGIRVNNVNVPSHDRQNPYTPSKFWGELRHGDLLTVWHNHDTPKEFLRFKFECYWGNSKEARKEGETFKLLPEAEILTEIEHVCLAQEKEMLAEIERSEEEERKNAAAGGTGLGGSG